VASLTLLGLAVCLCFTLRHLTSQCWVKENVWEYLLCSCGLKMARGQLICGACASAAQLIAGVSQQCGVGVWLAVW
jgi:hypothetical protein